MKNPEILIYGPIGSGGVTAEFFATKLKALGSGPITVRVNSPGGDAFDGLAIYNLIKAHGDITVIVDGLAASAASYAVLGAKRVEMATDAMLMIHAPHTAVSGESDSLRETADLLDKTEKQIAAIYSRRTGKTFSQVTAWLTGETWFTAAEAKAAGLIDDISSDVIGGQGIAFEYSYTFNSAPAAIAARLKPAQTAPEVDPIKAELASIKAEILARKTEERIAADIATIIDSVLKASIVRFAITNETHAKPLIDALRERGALESEIKQLKCEMRAVEVCNDAIRASKGTVASVNPQYDAYMDQLKKSRS